MSVLKNSNVTFFLNSYFLKWISVEYRKFKFSNEIDVQIVVK